MCKGICSNLVLGRRIQRREGLLSAEGVRKAVFWVVWCDGSELSLGVTSSDSDSAGLGWAMRFCISNKLASDADASGLWVALELQGWDELHLALGGERSRARQGGGAQFCLCVSGLCLPHTPYLVYPLIAAGHWYIWSCQMVKQLHLLFIQKENSHLCFNGLVTLLSLSQNICIWMLTRPHPSHPVALSSPCNSL